MRTFMRNIMLSEIGGLENYYSNNMLNTMLDKNSFKKKNYNNMQSRFREIKFKQPIYDSYSTQLLLSTRIFLFKNQFIQA